jgi:hypothetical protein
MSEQIFVSYRREDSSGTTGRLFDHLTRRFPRSRIFIDVDSIEPGEDFQKNIEQAVASCDVLLAVIGKRWLFSSDSGAKRLLDNPEDFVRFELVTALKRNIRVIPVLVEGASMPSSGDLPEELKPMTRRNAIELSHTRFDADADRIAGAIERALEQAKARREVAQQAGTAPGSMERGQTEHILAEKTETEQISFRDVETRQPRDKKGETSPEEPQTSGAKRHFLLRSILIAACLLIILVLGIVFLNEAKTVRVGDKVFLRSQEGSYVINAQISSYNWPRLGKIGKVPLTLLGNGSLQHRSVVQIQSLEDNLNGSDVLGAFADSRDCYYRKRGYQEKNQSWIITKLDASDSVLRYGDKIYLENVYHNSKRLTRDPQNGDYLTVDEGVDWWWVLEKK